MRVFIPVFIVLFLLGCRDEGQNMQAEVAYSGGMQQSFAFDAVAPPPARRASSMAMDRSRLGERRVAERHNLTIESQSDTLEARYQRDVAQCAQLHCILITGNIRNRRSAAISVRIIPKDLPAYLDFLQEGEGTITNHSVSADDKTMEYIDVVAELKNAEALRDRLRTLLDSPKADEVKDILNIERELARVQKKIDSATGRKRFIEKQTNFATVNVNYTVPHRLVEIKYIDLKNSFRNAWVGFIKNVAQVIEVSGKAIPWIPLLFIGLWLVVKIFRFAFGRGFIAGVFGRIGRLFSKKKNMPNTDVRIFPENETKS